MKTTGGQDVFTGSENDWIWLAGFTDGEGGFSIARVQRPWLTRRTYQAYLYWASTSLMLMSELHDWLGGSLMQCAGIKVNHKNFAKLSLHKSAAIGPICRMIPYLKIKLEQAFLFLEFDDLTLAKGAQAYRGRSDDDWNELESIFMKMKEANHRGK